MSEILGEARILIRPDTTAFRAQLEAQVLAASRSIPPVTVPVFAGGTGGTGVISKEIEQRQVLAGVQSVNIKRTSEEAKAVENAARHHEQFGRGIGANILQLLGLRGATLAASSAFIGGAAATIIAAKSIGAASDRTEQLNKSVEVFVGSADSVKQWSTTTATAMGISETAALKAASTFGQLFRTLGVGPAQAAHLSESLVRLASDLASFNNVGTDRALAALQSGLVGQARPLRQLGIFLTAARVQQEAFAETGKKTASELTQQDTILARYNLILQDSALAAGDFQRTQGRLANQGRILQAQLSDLAATTGNILIPALTEGIGTVNNLLLAFTRAETGAVHLFAKIKSGAKDAAAAIPSGDHGGLLGRVLGGVKGPLEDVARFGASIVVATVPALTFALRVKDVVDLLAHFGQSANNAGNQLSGFARDSGDAATAQDRLAKSVGGATRSITDQISALEIGQLKIQTGLTPGGRPAEEANLQQQIAADKKAVATSKSGTAARKKALQDLKSDQDALAALQAQDASDAQKNAQEIKTASEKAQAARVAANQASLDSFAGPEQARQNALTRAGLTKTLADDIAANRAIIAGEKAEIASIRDRIRSLHLHGEALKASLAAIRAANQVIFSTRIAIANAQAQQAQDRASAAQAARDARQAHLEAILSIAETTTSTRDDRSALEKIIAFDVQQIDTLKKIRHRTQEQNAQLDAYRVDLAQRTQALKALKNEAQKNLTAQAEFNFLQTQTGFVSNLLGNLIPGGATAGLVGGGGPSVPSNVRPTGQLSAAQTTSQANLVRPFTSGQGETQTNILRHILAELHRLNTGNEHPEAHKQRRTGAAVMDFQSASPGF